MSDSDSGSDDASKTGTYGMAGEKNAKFSSMKKHRTIVADILTSAKNGKIARLKGQLADYVKLSNDAAEKEKEKKLCDDSSKKATADEGGAAAAAPEEDDNDEEVTVASMIESIKDGPGRTMVHFAASRGHGKTVKWLCETCPGAADMLDNDGASALSLAAARGSEPAIKALLAAGASVDVADKSGARPLHHACGEGFAAAVELLAGAGADLEGQSGAGAPLHWAAGARRSDVTAALLRLGAQPDVKNDGGLTPILLAAAAGDGGSVAALARAGADVGFVLQVS